MLRVPPPFDGWLILDYDGVKRALNDGETFSSRIPAPKNWFIFLRRSRSYQECALISPAFTPRMIANLEPRIRELSRQTVPWQTPEALHVLGPASLPVRFTAAQTSTKRM